jgi:hypothetical protein
MRHCRVSYISVLDCAALCLIGPIIFSKRLRQLRLQAVGSRVESPGALDVMVLYKTPSWDTMPLHGVEYPVSAYWVACCRTGLFSRGARGGRAR